ncbi:uncharacterized protein LOC143226628 isoform X2 [Tachypleus tridentatus]|uniref:uncharacterized protein LOC143226628 isoform X2 n=1 Tax=Tachypleus tridentatus TaxID=6853 RepID=UPI003FD5732A
MECKIVLAILFLYFNFTSLHFYPTDPSTSTVFVTDDNQMTGDLERQRCEAGEGATTVSPTEGVERRRREAGEGATLVSPTEGVERRRREAGEGATLVSPTEGVERRRREAGEGATTVSQRKV